jgi:AraC family transcriptional regulator, transcriptional activator of pobA
MAMISTKKKPLHYGLYGENDFLLPDFMHCETIEFRTKLHHRTIKEHIHNSLFQIFIIESGKLDFFIETNKRIIVGPAIITIPENTLHGMKVEKNIKGKVLTLSTSFLETHFISSPRALLEMSRVHIITEFDNANSFEATRLFVDNLFNEMNEDLPEKKMVLQSYFRLLLSLTYRLLKKKSETLRGCKEITFTFLVL